MFDKDHQVPVYTLLICGLGCTRGLGLISCQTKPNLSNEITDRSILL